MTRTMEFLAKNFDEIDRIMGIENKDDDDLPRGAVAVTSNLDMLTDEPLELAIALRRLAESKADKDDWAKFAQAMTELVNDLKAINEPPPKAA